MALSGLGSVVTYLRKVTPAGDGDDTQLLARFVAGDELAFAALVHRYAPLVWGVCRRTLARPTDAEDAFQATFVVLFRKASSLGRGPLGPWLHTIARRTAVKARLRVDRHAMRETHSEHEPAYEPPPPDDLRPLLDQEIDRLPEKYRAPIVLCYLEGLTNEQAADRLGCPRGTILSRLSRGRDQLRERLKRRGVEMPSVLPVLAAPSALVEALVRSGPVIRDGGISASVTTLAEGVMISMSLHKMKLFAMTVLTLALLGGGAGLLASRPTPEQAGSRLLAQAGDVKTKEADAEKKDEPKAAPAKAPEEPARPPRDVELRELVAKTIDFHGLDDPQTTFLEALDQLSKIYRLSFHINEKAFKFEALEGVEKSRIANPNPIVPMKTSLRMVLHMILARVPASSGATFLIRKDHIEITTAAFVRRELGLRHIPLDAGPNDHLLPTLIHETFSKEPLDKALTRIAEVSEVSVLIDPKLDKKGSTEITATLRNVPYETAIELLTEMAGLAVVKRNNAYYVTTPENAERMKERLPKDKK